ncbi:UNVERIFIED_CONTAM: Retrovirus-related Pol polyprotein from transposon TNT 1-94 [Sesamum radiatum]|uniref:Retrovirus-related Pol polyprotein from transposon TNT 1-94 n=1 Tax=Sesamum radiatum TaxID=300843 RepID=A0AAW2Q1R6_SESRA
MASSEAKQRKEAVQSEMDSIVSNGTWVLVDLPPGYTTIGCKWIFKKKLKPDGTINKFKARLVAKGFKQKEEIEYFDTHSPVARLTTIQVLIALALVYSLLIHQMDVKTAFLYDKLKEEMYMDQLEGFVAHGNERKVCKLVKSLYGLKQAPKQWHEKFNKTILAFGFIVNENDKCIHLIFPPPAVSKLASSHPASLQPATRPVRDQASSHTASSQSAIMLACGLVSSHPASSRPAIRLARYLRASVLVELTPCELAVSDLAS